MQKKIYSIKLYHKRGGIDMLNQIVIVGRLNDKPILEETEQGKLHF